MRLKHTQLTIHRQASPAAVAKMTDAAKCSYGWEVIPGKYPS